MQQLQVEIKVRDQEPVSLQTELKPGATVVAPALPAGILESVKARVRVLLAEEEKIFMNGFQTWTYSPEYNRSGYTRDIGPIPELAIRHYGLRAYGDAYFVPYPQRPGVTHGESWCYFRDGERFRLFASLDERPGYTLFRYDSSQALLTIERDCAGLRVDGEYHALDLFYAEGTEQQVFDAWFAAMNIRPRTDRPIAGYSSWYNRYEDISQQTILSDLAGCETMLQPGDLFQIDDGWEPAVGDWLEPDYVKFPGRAVAGPLRGEKEFPDLEGAPGLAAAGGREALVRRGELGRLLFSGYRQSPGRGLSGAGFPPGSGRVGL